MALAFDFGTCNSVIARWNEALGDIETPELPNLGTSYPQPGAQKARVIPSMIHFGKDQVKLIGSQVGDGGLGNHPGTFRWLKMDMLRTGGPIGAGALMAQLFTLVLLQTNLLTVS